MKRIKNKLIRIFLRLAAIYFMSFSIFNDCNKINFCNSGDPFSDCYQKRILFETYQRDALLAATPPSRPQNVSVLPGNFNNIISWDPVSRATEYQLYWSNSPNLNIASAAKISKVSSPFIHSDLTNGRLYYYKITAKTPFLEGEPSIEATGLPFSSNRKIFVTGSSYSIPSMGSVAGADSICMNDSAKPSASTIFKALLADETGCSGNPCRRASIAANAGDGQIDWVFKPNTSYYRSDGTTLILTTNSNSIFVFGNFTNPITTTAFTTLTGMSGNWFTFANSNCTNYSSTGGSVTTSQSNLTSSAAISGAGLGCAGSFYIFCVEQ